MLSQLNKFSSLRKIFSIKLVANHRQQYSTSIKKMAQPPAECTDIVWMDLEMTGLCVRSDKILEVSCLITDKDLKIIKEGPCFAINHPKEVLDGMNEWCIKHHTASGLVQKCLESQIQSERAEAMLLEFLQQNIPKGKCPLAGNSVYMDRLFLREYMPSVDEYMHYRIIDVSTVKELASRWNPQVMEMAPKKRFAHRSLDDIIDSIEELKYYREHLFKDCHNKAKK